MLTKAAGSGTAGRCDLHLYFAGFPWCSTLFRRFYPREMLGVSLVVNNLAVLGLACAPTSACYSKILLISVRGCVGLTQAFSCVYSPLWVHDCAPKSKRDTWMSYLQGTNLSDKSNDTFMRLCYGIYCWRWPFLTQFVLTLPLSILFFFVPREHIGLRLTRRRSIIIADADEDEDANNKLCSTIPYDDEECILMTCKRNGIVSDGYSLDLYVKEENASKWSNLWLLLRHKVYVFIVMGLSGLFFVVAGVQFWTTLYLETNTKDSMNEIHVAYLLVPLLVSSSAVGSLVNSVATLVPIIKCKLCAYAWFLEVPDASLRCLCLPSRLRPLASSVAYASYNLFVYAASNYVPGLIMNFIIDPRPDFTDSSGLESGSHAMLLVHTVLDSVLICCGVFGHCFVSRAVLLSRVETMQHL
ncbi:hypothetical protein PsorP6_009978 [Peronosclerospora sorghi]|uniref:Uncharacterized protein n=1 Tax=Peronosclerospora sorghi TaxID=230839 RepID=A0ACC0VWN6_9STRA|nr:hypothetical protein PsorP6_009978 [Peronosclerospora sorghi]